VTITPEQVAGLRPGDVVELTDRNWPDGTILRGPLWADGDELRVGDAAMIRWPMRAWMPYQHKDRTLRVISRRPRPLYVNHDRTKPVPGDVVRDAKKHTTSSLTWGFFIDGAWMRISTGCTADRSTMPDRLRLLVDGETGMPVQP
jgi:hypothetical protein